MKSFPKQNTEVCERCAKSSEINITYSAVASQRVFMIQYLKHNTVMAFFNHLKGPCIRPIRSDAVNPKMGIAGLLTDRHTFVLMLVVRIW